MSIRDHRTSDEAGEESRYGEELLRANWNPVLDLLQWSSERTRAMTRKEAPAARSDEEAAAFLNRIYRSGG